MKKTAAMATVVASLGVSLGVNVGELLAMDLSATDSCGDLAQVTTEQYNLMSQVKMLAEQQKQLQAQINSIFALSRPYPLSQFTALQNNARSMMDQIKKGHEADYNLSRRIVTDNANLTTRINNLGSREKFLTDQVRALEMNQLKLFNLMQNIKIDQSK